MNDENKNGMTLVDVFKFIGKGKIFGLIFGSIIFVLVLFGIALVVNPLRSYYTVGFRYDYIPGICNGKKYVDGSAFDYFEIISNDNIEKIKNSKDEYKAINTSDLLDSKKFTITKNHTYFDEANEDYEVVDEYYLITCPVNVFKSKEVAKDFLIDLIKEPVRKTLVMIDELSYNNNLIAYKDSTTYGEKMTYLDNQISLLRNGYADWIAKETDTTVNVNNNLVKLSELKEDINIYLEAINYEYFKSEINLYGYVYNNNELTRLNVILNTLIDKKTQLLKEKTALNDQYNLFADAINSNLTNSTQIIQSDAFKDISNKMTEVNKQIIDNEYEQEIVQRKIDSINSSDKENSNAFKAKIDNVELKLEDLTKTYTTVSKELYNRNTIVYYTSSQIISVNSKINLIINGVISAACGLLFGLVGAFFNGKKKFETIK